MDHLLQTRYLHVYDVDGIIGTITTGEYFTRRFNEMLQEHYNADRVTYLYDWTKFALVEGAAITVKVFECDDDLECYESVINIEQTWLY